MRPVDRADAHDDGRTLDLLIFRVYDGKLLGTSILNYSLSGSISGDGSGTLVGERAGAAAGDLRALAMPAVLFGSGRRTVVGGVVGNAPIVISGSAAGAVAVAGAGSAPAGLAGSGAGSVSNSGAGSAAIAVAGSGAGTVNSGSTAPNDTFTGSAGTTLASHTPDDGGSWTKHPVSGIDNPMVLSNANRLSKEVSGTSVYYHSWTPANADYDVQCDVVRKGGGVSTSSGIGGRMSAAANTMYLAWYSHGAGGWQLWAGVAGSYTKVGESTQSLSDDTPYTLKLEMRGTAIKVFVNGTQVISVTDSGVTAAGKAGVAVGLGGDTAMTNTAGYHLDNFAAADA
ncbi:MAG: hypothetical protein U0992_08610 [Planctomycetaceae bacterium]